MGSTGAPSCSSSLLRAAVALLPVAARLETFDLRELPAFDPASPDEAGPLSRALKRRIREADAVLMIAPEYLYGLLPAIDNALRCAGTAGDNAWAGKPSAPVGTSPTANDWGRAQQHLRSKLLDLAMAPVEQPTLVIGRIHKAFDRGGRLQPAADRHAVSQLLANLARAGLRARRRVGEQDRLRTLMAAAWPSAAALPRDQASMRRPESPSAALEAAGPMPRTEAGARLWL